MFPLFKIDQLKLNCVYNFTEHNTKHVLLCYLSVCFFKLLKPSWLFKSHINPSEIVNLYCSNVFMRFRTCLHSCICNYWMRHMSSLCLINLISLSATIFYDIRLMQSPIMPCGFVYQLCDSIWSERFNSELEQEKKRQILTLHFCLGVFDVHPLFNVNCWQSFDLFWISAVFSR